MSAMAACTVVAGNFLPFARVLAKSFARFHPEIPLHILLAAGEADCDAAMAEGLRIVRLSELRIPRLPEMLLRYDRKQVVVALKPAMLRYLLDCGYASAVFLDADILVTASLDPLFDDVARHALCVTPHIAPAPATAQRLRLERTLLLAGMFNGGFIGASDREETRQFLAWWEARLRTHCQFAVRKGIHFDQRWLDLAPGFIGDLLVVRDPGCNVAYWNLPERDITRDGDGFKVNGVPLRFFHFSGFDPALPEVVSKYAPELSLDRLTPTTELLRHYAALLADAGWAASATLSWPWEPPLSFWQRLSATSLPVRLMRY